MSNNIYIYNSPFFIFSDIHYKGRNQEYILKVLSYFYRFPQKMWKKEKTNIFYN